MGEQQGIGISRSIPAAAIEPIQSSTPPVLARFSRGPLIETALRGHVAVVDRDGKLIAWAGNPDVSVFFRSSAKPFQALPLIQSGAADRYGIVDLEIALMCGSHSGSEPHQRVARSILRKIGLADDALQCGITEPLDPEAAARLALGLDEPSPVHCECSGKHAGMLAACLHQGYPIDSYLEPDHPLQQAILKHLSEATGVAPDHLIIAIDGCGLPTFGASLQNFAAAYSVIARDAMPGLKRIRNAMTSHPEMIAGKGEVDTDLIRLTGGRVVAKLGAEGLLCLALPETGIGIAISFEAGVERGHGPATVRVLEQLNVVDDSTLMSLRETFIGAETNFAGREVGTKDSSLRLTRSLS